MLRGREKKQRGCKVRLYDSRVYKVLAIKMKFYAHYCLLERPNDNNNNFGRVSTCEIER